MKSKLSATRSSRRLQPVPATGYGGSVPSTRTRRRVSRSSTAARPQTGMTFKRFMRLLMRCFIAAVIITSVWLGWRFYRNTAKLTGTNNPFGFFGALQAEPLKTQNGKTNILLAGYSADDPGHDGANLTDSIMVLSIDQAAQTAKIVSIPRDLYVSIPGYGYSKINAAYEYGESTNFSKSGYASGGMGLLQQVVSTVTGLDFQYYGLINYQGFKEAVDAVGGVTVTIESTDKRGVYEPYTNLKLPNGPAQLSGQQALNLARARGASYGSYGFATGDFERTSYQQKILLSLKDKAISAGVLANPFKMSNLYESIANNVNTDLKPGEARSLYDLASKIGDGSITNFTLNDVNGTNLLVNSTSRGGQSILIPAAGVGEYDDIHAALAN